MKIAMASDHAGQELRHVMAEYCQSKGHEVIDLGANGSTSVDYPVYGKKLAAAVQSGEADRGIAICGTGCGMALTINRFAGVRCVNSTDILTTRLSRQHNDANVIALGARIIGEDLAKTLVDTFLDTPFSGAERHANRIRMIDEP